MAIPTTLKKRALGLALPALLLVAVPAPSLAQTAEAQAEAHGGEGAAAAHGTPAINWFERDPQTPALAATILNFVLLVVLLFVAVRKPFGRHFKQRKAALESAIAEARTLMEQAERLLAEARAKTDALDLEMARLRHEILEAGKAEGARIDGEAEEHAERLRSDTQVMLEQEIARMTQAIREEVVDHVIRRAAEVVEKAMTGSEQERLAREYMTTMGSEQAPGGPER